MHGLLVCVLCQPVQSCIEPSLIPYKGVEFFLEIFLWRLVSVLFFGHGAAHALAVDASAHVCALTNMASNRLTLPSPQESASSKSQLRSKQSSKGTSPENFMIIGDCFESYAYRIYSAKLFEERRR